MPDARFTPPIDVLSSMDQALHALIRELVNARDFDSAASTVMHAMFAALETTLEHGPFAESARVLRGAVHLRPDDGYKRLWVESNEHSTNRSVVGKRMLVLGDSVALGLGAQLPGAH